MRDKNENDTLISCPLCNGTIDPQFFSTAQEFSCPHCSGLLASPEEEKPVRPKLIIPAAEEAERERLEQERADAARLVLLQHLNATVEDNEGDLSRLSYLEINELVENMQEFSGLAESLNPEEYAVREKLYRAAFFDQKLQAGLLAQQATLQTELLHKLNAGVGNQPSGSASQGSNESAKVALLAGGLAMHKLNQISQDVNEISEDTSDLSEGLGGF